MGRFLMALAVALAPILSARPAAASTNDLIQQLDQLTRSFAGSAGIWIADPATSKALYTHNPEEQVVTASLYKLALMAEAERRVDAGDLKYTDTITIEDDDITDDGSFEPAGTTMSLDEALESMITISDNGTARALWHVLGPKNVNAMLAAQGIPDFHVQIDLDEDNVATPHAIGMFMTLLAKRQLISPAASDRMLARLGRQQINNRLPAALPNGVVVAHKTGNLPGLTHDAGIVYTKFGPRVVVVMTWDADEPDADSFIADVGSLVYSAVLEPPANAKFDVPRTAVLADVGGSTRITVPITNIGGNPWAAAGTSSFRLIWEMRDGKDSVVATSAAPIVLPALQPDKTANVGVVLNVPKAAGDYKVTIGLMDADGHALAALGAATATFALRAHQPYLVNADMTMPTVMHQNEASLLITHYTALPTAGTSSHPLVLTWRLIDPRNGRAVTQGSLPVGSLEPGAAGDFFAPFIAPNLLGRYRLSYELRERNIAVSETLTSTVTITGPRTYPDDEGGRTPGPPVLKAPSPTPRFRFPAPSGSLVPNIPLPSLPPGRATPSPRPSP